MGDRFFEDADTSSSYQEYRPTYDGLGIEREVISFMGKSQERSEDMKTLALDIGCGTGQLTRVLAPLFTKMIGIDCSESQIKVAKEVTNEDNVEYKVTVAEDLSFLEDNSVDFISTACAIHFFKPEPFLAEVCRVLKPGGSLLFVIFAKDGFSLKVLTDNDETNNKCMDVIQEVVTTSFRLLKDDVKKVIKSGLYPAPDYPDSHQFQITSKRQYDDIDQFVGFLKSTGTLPIYNQEHPEEGDQIEKVKKRLLSALADISSTPETTPIVMSILFNCHLYRKPL